MIALSVNVNKIALIRNSREGNYPSVVDYASTCIDAGADGITVHPRPDQRHIRPTDVRELSELCRAKTTIAGTALEFNIEGNPFAEPLGEYPGLLALVEQTQPQQCTLVPDSSEQLTSDHGFDLSTSAEKLKPLVAALQALDVRVSLFMDPDKKQLDLARQLGVERIELYTGPYAAAQDDLALLKNYFDAARHASDIGLGVNAGHDLNLHNLGQFATAPGLLEVSIGHALIVDAIDRGLAPAVKAYKTLLEKHHN
ncbi:MAG: pyridoxine 5'-phosphate synthase [Gammaproteobacteria bacterium]|nr:pyridoxine 5'-phosphate synthase [Gammaproteobacteria bacterium]MBQ0839890.1 pyridoxine 5'-phosphate synthase [Gammaproteobacteria bacterium]